MFNLQFSHILLEFSIINCKLNIAKSYSSVSAHTKTRLPAGFPYLWYSLLFSYTASQVRFMPSRMNTPSSTEESITVE